MCDILRGHWEWCTSHTAFILICFCLNPILSSFLHFQIYPYNSPALLVGLLSCSQWDLSGPEGIGGWTIASGCTCFCPHWYRILWYGYQVSEHSATTDIVWDVAFLILYRACQHFHQMQKICIWMMYGHLQFCDCFHNQGCSVFCQKGFHSALIEFHSSELHRLYGFSCGWHLAAHKPLCYTGSDTGDTHTSCASWLLEIGSLNWCHSVYVDVEWLSVIYSSWNVKYA